MNETSSSAINATEKSNSTSLPEMFTLYWEVLKPGLLLNKKLFIAGYVFGVLASLSGIFVPVLIQRIIDDVLPDKNQGLLLWAFFLTSAALLGYLILNSIQIFFNTTATENTFFELRKRLVHASLTKKIAFFSKFEKGDLMTRLSNDIDTVSTFFYESIIQASVSLLLFVVFSIFILIWHWQLGCITLLSFPVYLIILSWAHKHISSAAGIARSTLSSLNDTMLDILSGYKDIRFFQQTSQADARFMLPSEAYRKANIRSIRLADWFVTSMENLGYAITLIPFFIGGYLLCRETPGITIGVIVAYYAYATYLSSVFVYSIEGATKLTKAEPLIRRIKEIIDFPTEENMPITNIGQVPESTILEMKNVSFRYPGSKGYILKNFNLTVKPGEKIAIVGKSGSGKSTVLNLLLRFIEAEEGSIMLDGREISSYPLNFYLQYFAYASQSPHLFKLSVRENIAMGWYHVPDESISAAVKTVRLSELIEGLPLKYDTVIGRAGIDFSGGQKQRLILARALIREPAILLLDEFTSALDKTIEQEIIDDLLKIFEQQTIICVTHSTELARKFQRVIEFTTNHIDCAPQSPLQEKISRYYER